MLGLLNEEIFSCKHSRRVKRTLLIFDSPWKKANIRTQTLRKDWRAKKPSELTLNSVTARTSFGNRTQTIKGLRFNWNLVRSGSIDHGVIPIMDQSWVALDFNSRDAGVPCLLDKQIFRSENSRRVKWQLRLILKPCEKTGVVLEAS